MAASFQLPAPAAYITVMTTPTFDPDLHPRSTGGTFASKDGSAPQTSLDAVPRSFREFSDGVISDFKAAIENNKPQLSYAESGETFNDMDVDNLNAYLAGDPDGLRAENDDNEFDYRNEQAAEFIRNVARDLGIDDDELEDEDSDEYSRIWDAVLDADTSNQFADVADQTWTDVSTDAGDFKTAAQGLGFSDEDLKVESNRARLFEKFLADAGADVGTDEARQAIKDAAANYDQIESETEVELIWNTRLSDAAIDAGDDQRTVEAESAKLLLSGYGWSPIEVRTPFTIPLTSENPAKIYVEPNY